MSLFNRLYLQASDTSGLRERRTFTGLPCSVRWISAGKRCLFKRFLNNKKHCVEDLSLANMMMAFPSSTRQRVSCCQVSLCLAKVIARQTPKSITRTRSIHLKMRASLSGASNGQRHIRLWRPSEGSLSLDWRESGCQECFYLLWKLNSLFIFSDNFSTIIRNCSRRQIRACQ